MTTLSGLYTSAGAFALEASPADVRTVSWDHTSPSFTVATAGRGSPYINSRAGGASVAGGTG